MRFKLVAPILLILPIFSLVLAAPIPVRKVRDAYADSNAMEGDKGATIVSEKRAPRGDLYKRDSTFSDDSNFEWWKPNQANGVHPDVKPSPSSGGGESPLWSKVWSKQGGTDATEGVAQFGTTAENRPASTTSNKVKSVSWAPTNDVQLPSGDVVKRPLGTDINLLAGSPPPGREGYLAKQRPKSFGGKIKAFFSKLGKFRFRPRSQRTVNTRA
jgi:hypothetical protein